jgi:Ca2+-binding RTX toxin-like protein
VDPLGEAGLFSEQNSQSSLIYGGRGNDTIYGGLIGNDVIFGEAGSDLIFAGAGFDLVYGGGGNDTISAVSRLGPNFYEDSPDVLFGGAGDDLISVRFRSGGGMYYGGIGNDTITVSTSGDSSLSGGVLFGEDGDDSLTGGGGDDLIYAGSGSDTIFGAAGNDRLFGYATVEGAGETGEEVEDMLRLFDLLEGLITFEEVFGAQPFVFADGAQNIRGGGGNDTIAGGRADDVLRGGNNDDAIWAAGGNDILYGDLGDDVLGGGFGNDTIFGGDGFDFIVGGRGADRLTGGADSDVFVFTQFEESRSGAGNRDVITDFTIEQDIIDLSRMSQAGVNIAFAYDTGDGFGLTPVGDFDFSRELVDVVLFTEITATGTLVRAQHFDVFWFGDPDPGTADTDFEIEILGVFGLDLFNFDTGFNRG